MRGHASDEPDHNDGAYDSGDGMAKQVQTEFDWFAQRAAATPALPAVEEASALNQALLPGMQVEGDDQEVPAVATSRERRHPAVLPVPKPLPSAIERGHFGEDEHGPIRPTSAEVRAITENLAERLVNLRDGLAEVERFMANSQCSDRGRLYHEKDRLLSAYQGAIAMYAEDFGEPAANRVDAYARHQRVLR